MRKLQLQCEGNKETEIITEVKQNVMDIGNGWMDGWMDKQSLLIILVLW